MAEDVTQHELKKGDTAIPLEFTLKASGVPYAVPAGSVVKLLMTLEQQTILKVNANCAMNADQMANPGKGIYNWQPEDVDTEGTYDIEFLVILPDLSQVRFPRNYNEKFGTVIILPSKS
jgi:hypothetical protein